VICLCLSMDSLAEPAGSDDAAAAWKVSLEPENFRAVLQGVKEEALDSRVIGVVSNRKAVEQTASNSVGKLGDGCVFEVAGRVPDRRTMKWVLDIPPQDAKSFQYYMFRYKAKGIFRDYTKYGVVALSGKDDSGKAASEKLIDCSQVVNDDKWHTVVGKRQIAFPADSVAIEINTNDSVSSFAIDSLSFSDQMPQPPIAAEWNVCEGKDKQGFAILDLENVFNDTYGNAVERVLTKHVIITDNCDIFSSERLLVKGVPFNVKAEGNNIVTSHEDGSANEGQVDFLGTKVPRKYFFPVSRDDVMTISVDKKASEVFLVLVSEFPASSGRYGIPDAPVYFDDIEMFSIELVYDDGQSDLAFPYSIADDGYIIRRSVGAYAVAADENRKLRSLVFRNRFFGATVGVAAVTLNTSQNRVIAKLVEDPEITRTPILPEPPFKTASIKKAGDIISFTNSYYELAVNCAGGFTIEKIINRWSAGTEQSLDKTSGLRVTVGSQVFTGQDFSVENVDIEGLKATFQLQSKVESVPLELTVSISIDDTAQMAMRILAKNTSQASLSPEIKFPFVKGIQLGGLKDTWICFPTYRNVISDQESYNIASNDHTFPMQFYDVYNPQVGIGLSFITHSLKHNPIDYSLSKDSGGVCAFIQYPKEFYAIGAGQTVEFPETAIVSHNGDWRQAVAAYKDWLDTWYKPGNSSDRNWFNKISLVKDYFLPETVSLRDLKVPSMYNSKTGKFKIKEYLENDKEYWGGLSPDLIHFFHWSHLDEDQEGVKDYGNYGYDYYKGLDNFKSALSTIQNEYHTPVSLYMVPDRCSTGTQTGKRLGEKAVKLRADGSQLANSTTWYVCPQQKDWLDDFVANAKKIQKETNANVMYFDVVGFWRTNTCYSKEHGHPIPSWYNEATFDLMKSLREALPSNVAIWTEYPLTDVNTQYTDGNIAYYYLTLYELWAKPYDTLESANMYSDPSVNLFRFIFPHVKQVDLPIGNERAANGVNRLKFTFFNGDAIYDNGWLSMQSRTRTELMVKSMAIKQKFRDCFYSSNITPLVSTEQAKVYANKFAGKDKTVYTLYNGRYTTVRGGVLAIEHKEGAAYYDLWNEKDITPQIVEGRAIIEQKLDPQGLGCIVQYEKGAK